MQYRTVSIEIEHKVNIQSAKGSVLSQPLLIVFISKERLFSWFGTQSGRNI